MVNSDYEAFLLKHSLDARRADPKFVKRMEADLRFQVLYADREINRLVKEVYYNKYSNACQRRLKDALSNFGIEQILVAAANLMVWHEQRVRSERS